MRVLIVGAGGFVGRHLAGRLAADGVEVVAAGRDSARLRRLLPGFAVTGCDLARDGAADWLPRLAGIDAVVNCAGLIQDGRGGFDAVHDRGARALFDAAAAAGVGRVVQVSALGADDTATTRYHRSKRAADDHLAAMSSLDWAIVRPSLIVGRGGQSTALFTTLAAALPWPVRLGPGDWRLQPIHVADLVDGIARLLSRPEPIRARLNAAGPAPMTTDAVTRTLRTWLGLSPRPMLTIPRPVLAFAMRVGGWLRLGAASPGSLAMLERGNVGDPSDWIAATGIGPAPLEVALARTPAGSADRTAARLAPLAPVLRMLLALVWLAGGLIPLLLTPQATSMQLLAATGVSGAAALVAFYGAAALDIAIGLALLAGRHVARAAWAGIALTTAYSAILAVCLPALWADPFGPLVKNLAVLGLSLAVAAQGGSDD